MKRTDFIKAFIASMFGLLSGKTAIAKPQCDPMGAFRAEQCEILDSTLHADAEIQALLKKYEHNEKAMSTALAMSILALRRMRVGTDSTGRLKHRSYYADIIPHKTEKDVDGNIITHTRWTKDMYFCYQHRGGDDQDFDYCYVLPILGGNFHNRRGK